VTLPGEPVGGIGLHTRQGAGTMEIGYWIAATQIRRGYATEGSARLTDAAFALAGVVRAQIRCDQANQASAAVPRKLRSGAPRGTASR
jgi:RimJ/RimL family protein N-acetyltransferase